MKFLIILTLASIFTSSLQNSVYVRPKATANYINNELQTPYGPDSFDRKQTRQSQNYAIQDQNYASQTQSYGNQVQILKYENEIDDNGWHYAFETSDGTKVQQDGRSLPVHNEDRSLSVSGSYSYVGDDGQTYSITYTADENGYHPSGDHLPTPPPIPEEILRSLQLTAGHDGQYGGRKSSYDADAGF